MTSVYLTFNLLERRSIGLNITICTTPLCYLPMDFARHVQDLSRDDLTSRPVFKYKVHTDVYLTSRTSLTLHLPTCVTVSMDDY